MPLRTVLQRSGKAMVGIKQVRSELSHLLKTVNWDTDSEASIRDKLREKLGAEVDTLPDFKKVVKVRFEVDC